MKKFLAFFALCLALCLVGAAIAEDAGDGIINDHLKIGDVVKQATCTENGLKVKSIEPNGEIQYETIFARGHEWDDGVVTEEADCVTGTPGVKTFTCKHTEATDEYAACEATKTEAVAPTHKWSSEQTDEDNWGDVEVEPTCTSTGLARDYCVVCHVKGEKTRVIDKTAHVYVWVVDKKATCKDDGAQHLECKYCKEAKADKDYTEEETALKVIAADPTIATKLGETDKHDWDGWVTEQVATCFKPLVQMRTCKICGVWQRKEYKQEDYPKAEQDKYLEDGRLAPVYETRLHLDSCFQATEYKVCKICNGEAEGHGEVPTGKVLKYPEIYACEFDHTDTIYASEEDIKKDPDKKWLKEFVAAGKLDEDGNITDCEAEGYILYNCIHVNDDVEMPEGAEHKVDKVRIPAPGHKYGDWEMLHAPGEGDNELGMWYRTCTVCKKTEQYSGAVPPTGATALKNGLQKDEDGKYRYYTDNKVDTTKTGIVTFEGGEFFVANGELCDTANGLNQNVDGNWYFLSNGQIQRKTTFAEYDNNWFIIKNGELDVNANGLYDYDGGKFIFAAGKLIRGVNGLWQNTDGSWYYVADGQVANYTGLVEYDGAWFYVKSGKLASDFEGVVNYGGKDFKVVAGQVVNEVAEAEEVEETADAE